MSWSILYCDYSTMSHSTLNRYGKFGYSIQTHFLFLINYLHRCIHCTHSHGAMYPLKSHFLLNSIITEKKMQRKPLVKHPYHLMKIRPWLFCKIKQLHTI